VSSYHFSVTMLYRTHDFTIFFDF